MHARDESIVLFCLSSIGCLEEELTIYRACIRVVNGRLFLLESFFLLANEHRLSRREELAIKTESSSKTNTRLRGFGLHMDIEGGNIDECIILVDALKFK